MEKEPIQADQLLNLQIFYTNSIINVFYSLSVWDIGKLFPKKLEANHTFVHKSMVLAGFWVNRYKKYVCLKNA